jgi:hypothetical protein
MAKKSNRRLEIDPYECLPNGTPVWIAEAMDELCPPPAKPEVHPIIEWIGLVFLLFVVYRAFAGG